jgi:hypothetical protein
MSRTVAIFLALALVWLTAWEIAGYYMRQAGTEKLLLSKHVSAPATGLERGADFRGEGIIVDGPLTVAPHSQQPCLAALTNIFVMSHYLNSQEHEELQLNHIATRRVGSASIVIAVGNQRVELPLEQWSPQTDTSEDMANLPPRLGVTSEEIARGRASARGTLGNYRVTEATLLGGTHFFVVGHIEDRDGPLRITADRMLKRVELFQGSQDQLVNTLRGSGNGLRIAGWIFSVGLGPLPLSILGMILWMQHKRSRRAAQPGLTPPSQTT